MKAFLSIQETARITGLSQYYLRQGVRNGTVPHIRSGTKYLINLRRLLKTLDALPMEEEETDE
ncbi:MAG: excisionase family DNA-binding protein [Oscillospiraceae bacterium]|nr:excisionase family DNA-binding protein [Oscillospiraceae bacterium]